MNQNFSIFPNCRISLKPPPCVDPTKATLAYGRLAIPRLNRELQDVDLLTRQRAIKTLCDYLHDPEHIHEAICGGIIPSLVKLLTDDDEYIRAITAECFVILNRKLIKIKFIEHSNGREAFIENNVYESIKLLFSSSEKEIIRLNAHRAIELLVLNPLYAEILVKRRIISCLLSCYRREIREIQIVILDALNKCLAINPEDGLNAGGIEAFYNTLTHLSSDIRHKSVQAMHLLVASDRGKTETIEKGMVPKLIELLSDSNSEIQASAAGALAFICVKTEGRYACLKGFAIPSLLKCLFNSNSRVRALGCIAEAPEGRSKLQISLVEIYAWNFNA
uniref:Rhabdoid tumor deletion region protein 1 n=1 Tax=Rodentolepis nana TaxID=102285 RepID=A0A0R3TZR8_RODNA